MKSRSNVSDRNAPKPVHSAVVSHHGLLGIPYVRQHMMIDERWTMNSLKDQIVGMGDLMAKSMVFKSLEGNVARERNKRAKRNLKRQCHDGRIKLNMMLYGTNVKSVKNFLINHKDMQRLYQKMPVHLVVDNINQRTFVMRKERDRLQCRLDQLKKKYEETLIARSQLENRIKYEDEFALEEEIKWREFMKKIENSNVRLQAIKTINSTYKKMIQVLRQESIFYEPILRSLRDDIDNQGNFIKHILYIGMPAIDKFKCLSQEYRKLEEKTRQSISSKLEWMANCRRSMQTKRRSSIAVFKAFKHDSNLSRYVRETDSMLVLKNTLEMIEDTIKRVKSVTLCSQHKETYQRIKTQMDNNDKLLKTIGNVTLSFQGFESKMMRAEVLEGVLINHLSKAELSRLDHIKSLQDMIAVQDEKQASTMEYMKNRASAFVLMRFTLWTMNEILRYVEHPTKLPRIEYPSSYLKLPLLKFEMFIMRALSPNLYEADIGKIMDTVKYKVSKLMQSYNKELPKEDVQHNADEYYNILMDDDDPFDNGSEYRLRQQESIVEDDVLADAKSMQNVPTRKQIKTQSAKVIESLSKKED